MNHTPYVYVRSEPELWTVGFYAGDKWHPDGDHSTKEAAAERVHYLNGGDGGLKALNAELVEALKVSRNALIKNGHRPGLSGPLVETIDPLFHKLGINP